MKGISHAAYAGIKNTVSNGRQQEGTARGPAIKVKPIEKKLRKRAKPKKKA